MPTAWEHSPDKRAWSKRIMGKMHMIVQTSGTKLPFCCYAGNTYLGPAPDFETAKTKCEKLQASSRDPAPIDVPVEKSVESTTKPRTTRLPRR